MKKYKILRINLDTAWQRFLEICYYSLANSAYSDQIARIRWPIWIYTDRKWITAGVAVPIKCWNRILTIGPIRLYIWRYTMCRVMKRHIWTSMIHFKPFPPIDVCWRIFADEFWKRAISPFATMFPYLCVDMFKVVCCIFAGCGKG